MTTKEHTDLCRAVNANDEGEVARILGENPSLDISITRTGREINTIMHACANNHPMILRLLLDHPGVDVNVTMQYGWTAFVLACNAGSVGCAKMLIDDPRTNLTQPNDAGLYNVLCFESTKNQQEIIRWWIASGREGVPVGKNEYRRVPDLIERFRHDPEGARYQARAEVGYPDEAASSIFAHVVFLCDGLLGPKKTGGISRTLRFFGIVSRLPMELQMVLCYRVAGSARTNIPAKIKEMGFREIVRGLAGAVPLTPRGYVPHPKGLRPSPQGATPLTPFVNNN